MTDEIKTEPLVVKPVTLQGRHVRLEPLSRDHRGGLAEVGLVGDLFRYMPAKVESPEEMAGWVEVALIEREQGKSLPFATVEVATGRVVGSTRFMAIEPTHRRLEIGSTWIGRPWQRSAINTEAKLLMLGHAFDNLGANRVELKTDALNTPSRTAILRIGATEEGTFRHHMIVKDGRIRDTVYFSIIAPEWPEIRDRLVARLG